MVPASRFPRPAAPHLHPVEAVRLWECHLLLKLRDGLNTGAETLWGVWLLPLGTLVYRSRFLPRFLGVWLWLGGISYVVLSVTGVLWPEYAGTVNTMSQPFTFAEIAIVLWLVIKGAVPPSRDQLETIEG